MSARDLSPESTEKKTSFAVPRGLALFPRPLRVGVIETENARKPALPSGDRRTIGTFCYTLSGQGVLRGGGTEYGNAPEEVGLLYLSAERCGVYCSDEAQVPWRFLFLQFVGAAAIVREMHYEFGHAYCCPRDCCLILRLLDHAESREANVQLSFSEASCLVMDLVGTLAEMAGASTAQPSCRGVAERAKREIHRHLGSNEQELARILRVSPEHLSRRFKKETGQTLHDYVVQERMRRARVLLSATSLSCAQIASKVGYRQESYFAKLFKEYTGVTPTRYRRGGGRGD